MEGLSTTLRGTSLHRLGNNNNKEEEKHFCMNFCYFSHDLSVDFSRDLFVALKKIKNQLASFTRTKESISQSELKID